MAEIEVYQVGDIATLRGTFTDADGNLFNPDTVKFVVRKPSGEFVTKTGGAVTNQSTGLFIAEHAVDAPGRWFYRCEASGTGQASDERLFMVEPSAFAEMP